MVENIYSIVKPLLRNNKKIPVITRIFLPTDDFLRKCAKNGVKLCVYLFELIALRIRAGCPAITEYRSVRTCSSESLLIIGSILLKTPVAQNGLPACRLEWHFARIAAFTAYRLKHLCLSKIPPKGLSRRRTSSAKLFITAPCARWSFFLKGFHKKGIRRLDCKHRPLFELKQTQASQTHESNAIPDKRAPRP